MRFCVCVHTKTDTTKPCKHTQTQTPRGSGWRVHCGVEVTESSTNKQQTLARKHARARTHTHTHAYALYTHNAYGCAMGATAVHTVLLFIHETKGLRDERSRHELGACHCTNIGACHRATPWTPVMEYPSKPTHP
jgi:tRNA(Leu) C34 or U34 (ribose-2'-O)-methylase TrmL